MLNVKSYHNLKQICPRHWAAVAPLVLSLLIFASCSSKGDEAEGRAGSTPATAGSKPTTASAEQAAAGQLDSSIERYLPAEERLKRRQDRIKAVLSGTTTTATAP